MIFSFFFFYVVLVGKPVNSFHVNEYHLRSWYKGADTTSILLYLQERVEQEIKNVEEEFVNYFKLIHAMISAGNRFMRTLFHCALWLTEGERDILIGSGTEVAQVFKQCARFAYARGLTRWKLQPKFHMLGEIIFEMEEDKRNGCESLSPLASSTQMDEDFVGHISQSSRHVSIRTLHEKTIGRYKLLFAMHSGNTPP